MPQATNEQMQRYADERVRPGVEAMRSLVLRLESDKAAIEDIYDRASNGAARDDNRTDGPPHLADEQSMLKYNAFISDVLTAIKGHGEYANMLALCVRPVQG